MTVNRNRVKWNELKNEKISKKPAMKKEYNTKGSTFVNINMPFRYDYGTDVSTKLDDLFLVLPSMYIDGINYDKGISMKLVFDHINIPEHKSVLAVLDSLKAKLDGLTYESRFELESPLLEMSDINKIKGFYYIAYSKKTGKKYLDNPFTYFAPLCTHDFARTTFFGLDKKEIPWSMVENMRIKATPVLHIRHACAKGNGISYSTQLSSLTVEEIMPIPRTVPGADLADDINIHNPEALAKYQAQMAALKTFIPPSKDEAVEGGENDEHDVVEDSPNTPDAMEQICFSAPVRSSVNNAAAPSPSVTPSKIAARGSLKVLN